MSLRDRLAGFEHSPLATWVDSYEVPIKLLWANAAGVALWNGESLDELRAREFEITETTKLQRHAWMTALRAGEIDHFKVDWTLYPKGVPTLLTLYGTHVELDDGQFGLLYHAIPKEIPLAPEIARNSEAVRHISAAVAMLTMRGTEISRNPAAIAAFGLVTPISAWFDDDSIWRDIIRCANAGEIYRGEGTSSLSKELRTYAIEARKVQDPVSGDEAILIHLLDETALVRVQRQEQRWRALLDSAPDVILIVDRQHRIEFANRGLSGKKADGAALAGQRVEELFQPGSRESLSATVEAAFERGVSNACGAFSGELDAARQHDVRIAPIDTGGAVEHLIVIASDVTDQRDLERQLHHSQKMQVIGAIAGSIAHDFNNLLSVMIGASDLAELQLEAGHPVRGLIDEISEAAQRAHNLTQQMLSFSRKQAPAPKRLELNRHIGNMSRLLARAVGSRVTLKLAFGDSECWTHADPGQLDQILMNLALNARDAMPDGGTLSIATSCAELESASGPEVMLEVTDTGVGMSEELQARVFEPFFTTKAAGRGTGLGLSTVMRLIEQADGRLELDSEVGRGTRFEIRLPRVDRE